MPAGMTVHVCEDGGDAAGGSESFDAAERLVSARALSPLDWRLSDGAHPVATIAVTTTIGRPIMFRPGLDEAAW
jgi:hypothetical protein